MRGEWRINLATFTASLLINGAVLYSFDHAAIVWDRQVAQEIKKKASEGPVRFEFVEAPPKTHPAKPRPTRKISSRDALSQDLLKDKSRATDAPRAKVGQADQLAQVQSSPAQAPSPAGDITDQIALKLSEKGTAPFLNREPHGKKGAVPFSDKITTPETARRKSGGALLYGATSFEATGSGMGEYMKRMKERVWQAWFPYLAFKYPLEFRGADAVIGITLDAEGRVRAVEVVNDGGDAIFAAYCVDAVRRASGFGPLPKEILALLGKDELEIKFAFHYR